MLSGHGDGFRDVWGREFGSGDSAIVGGIGVGHRRPGVAQLTLPEMEGFAVYLIDLARSQPIYSTRLPMCRCHVTMRRVYLVRGLDLDLNLDLDVDPVP